MGETSWRFKSSHPHHPLSRFPITSHRTAVIVFVIVSLDAASQSIFTRRDCVPLLADEYIRGTPSADTLDRSERSSRKRAVFPFCYRWIHRSIGTGSGVQLMERPRAWAEPTFGVSHTGVGFPCRPQQGGESVSLRSSRQLTAILPTRVRYPDSRICVPGVGDLRSVGRGSVVLWLPLSNSCASPGNQASRPMRNSRGTVERDRGGYRRHAQRLRANGYKRSFNRLATCWRR